MSRFKVENQIWNVAAETMPRAALGELQLARLRECLERALQVPYYRDALATAGVGPQDIRCLDDVRRLPLTGREDLQAHYPLGMSAAPREKLARIHSSSGSRGKPVLVPYTAGDLALWSELCARVLVAGGLRPAHMVHIAFGYGLFTGGFGMHQGAERVGAAVVPAATGNSIRQAMLLKDLAADALVSTPSYALKIAEVARTEGIEPAGLALSLGFFGGEPWTEDMRAHLEKQLGIAAFDNYGLSEIIGPGVSGECAAQAGMHLQEDHFLVECLDLETLRPVPPGEPGELVITTLTREAMPLLRYRTRDIASLCTEPCACGRTTARMSRVRGRSDDMLIIRGVNVFPTQIEEALLRVEGIAPHYLIEVDRPGALDRLTVKVEVSPRVFSDRMREMQALRGRIDREIHARLGIRANVELVEPQTLTRSVSKSRRVIDRRGTSPPPAPA